MTAAITRHFVTVDGRWGPRQVHYRRAGHGPAVLLLHQSPQSSREMLELMQQWALHFTVIAPDTPGYGQSDALGPPQVSIAQFAEALREFVDAIGLRRFGIYGYHTGSSIGLWLAAAEPGRVTALAANGLVSLTAAEADEILAHYLPLLTPAWDGSHLVWLWARVREQLIFFPWHERRAAARMPFDVPAAERLHFSVMEFMRAGDHYALAYRAAFESQPVTVLPGLQTPLLVTATSNDPLRRHLERLGPLPPLSEVTGSENHADAFARCLRHLLAHPGDAPPAPVATRALSGRLWNTMISTDTGQVHALMNTTGAAEPVVLLHGAGASAETVRHLTTELSGQRPVVIPDLPGHGETQAAAGAAGQTISTAASCTLAVLDALGLNQVILAGQGAGAWVAVEASRRSALRRRRLALIDTPFLAAPLRTAFREHGAPSLAPQWHGAHLLAGWHMLRDGRLFFPWFARTAASARRSEPDLDPVRLHLELRELLKAEGAWQDLLLDAVDYPHGGALDHLQEGLAGAAPSSAWSECTQSLARARGALAWVGLPDQPSRWLPELLRQWD